MIPVLACSKAWHLLINPFVKRHTYDGRSKFRFGTCKLETGGSNCHSHHGCCSHGEYRGKVGCKMNLTLHGPTNAKIISNWNTAYHRKRSHPPWGQKIPDQPPARSESEFESHVPLPTCLAQPPKRRRRPRPKLEQTANYIRQ